MGVFKVRQAEQCLVISLGGFALALEVQGKSSQQVDSKPEDFCPRAPAPERKRTREMAEQTRAIIDDPAGAFPHYPMWDMNRGFGP